MFTVYGSRYRATVGSQWHVPPVICKWQIEIDINTDRSVCFAILAEFWERRCVPCLDRRIVTPAQRLGNQTTLRQSYILKPITLFSNNFLPNLSTPLTT